MENNLPDKYNENFRVKIKRFFSSFFKKKNIEENKEVQKENNDKIMDNSINEIKKMKEESKKAQLKEDILEMTKNNPKLIETLSTAQLKELNNMYDKVIEENNRKIDKLKSSLN